MVINYDDACSEGQLMELMRELRGLRPSLCTHDMSMKGGISRAIHYSSCDDCAPINAAADIIRAQIVDDANKVGVKL